MSKQPATIAQLPPHTDAKPLVAAKPDVAHPHTKIVVDELPSTWEYALASAFVIIMVIFILYALYQWYNYNTTINAASAALGVPYNNATQFSVALQQLEHDSTLVNELTQKSITDNIQITALNNRINAINAGIKPVTCPPTLDPSLVFDTSNDYLLDYYLGTGNGAAMESIRSTLLTNTVDPVLSDASCGPTWDDITNTVATYNASIPSGTDPCSDIGTLAKSINANINTAYQQKLYCPTQPYTGWTYVVGIDPSTNQPSTDKTQSGWVPSIFASTVKQPVLNAIANYKPSTASLTLQPTPAQIYINGPTSSYTTGYAAIDPSLVQDQADGVCSAEYGTLPVNPLTMNAGDYSMQLTKHICGLDTSNTASYNPTIAARLPGRAKSVICDDAPTSAVRLGLERGIDMVLGRVAKAIK